MSGILAQVFNPDHFNTMGPVQCPIKPLEWLQMALMGQPLSLSAF